MLWLLCVSPKNNKLKTGFSPSEISEIVMLRLLILSIPIKLMLKKREKLKISMNLNRKKLKKYTPKLFKN